MGIEPTSEAWEASILPLYDARSSDKANKTEPASQAPPEHRSVHRRENEGKAGAEVPCAVAAMGQTTLQGGFFPLIKPLRALALRTKSGAVPRKFA